MRQVKEPVPKNQILKDLTKIIHEYAAKDYHPMVIGDFNDVTSSKEMEDFMEENNLSDIIRDMHVLNYLMVYSCLLFINL